MLALLLPAWLALHAGCSTLRLAYGQGPQLAYWWLDGYADFDDLQQPAVEDAIAGWFRWNRDTQLPGYARLLDQASAMARGPVDASEICRFADAVVEQAALAFEQAVPRAAEVARTLGPAQFDAIERKYAKNVAEFREEYLDGTPEERAARMLDRTEERLGRFYGGFDEGQRGQMAAWLATAPFEPQRWLDERIERQRELLGLLRGLHERRADQATAERALRGYAANVARSPRESYRRYVDRVRQFNCEFVAKVQSITTPQQRETASSRFAGWAADLRSLSN